MILRLFGVLLCGLGWGQMAQAQEELNAETLQQLLLPNGAVRIVVQGGKGNLEENRVGQEKTKDFAVRGKLDILLADQGVSFRITLERNPAELFISWNGRNANSRTGDLTISGRYPIWEVPERAGFQGSSSLHWTEDRLGVRIEETHFPYYEGPYDNTPKAQRTDMQKVEVVIRPDKIRFLIKSRGPFRTGIAVRPPLVQKFTMEFDR